jgi:hypothetical protein
MSQPDNISELSWGDPYPDRTDDERAFPTTAEAMEEWATKLIKRTVGHFSTRERGREADQRQTMGRAIALSEYSRDMHLVIRRREVMQMARRANIEKLEHELDVLEDRRLLVRDAIFHLRRVSSSPPSNALLFLGDA